MMMMIIMITIIIITTISKTLGMTLIPRQLIAPCMCMSSSDCFMLVLVCSPAARAPRRARATRPRSLSTGPADESHTNTTDV